MRVMSITMAIN